MRKRKHKLINCYTVAVTLLLCMIPLNMSGSVSARYVTSSVFSDVITVPKNYYTVTYYQHDGTVLQNVNVFRNTAHSLRDGTDVLLPSNARSFAGWVNALGNSPDLSKRKDYGLYPTFEYPDIAYEVRFMDMKGEELLGTATFKKSQAGQKVANVITDLPTAPTLTDFEFTGWGVKTESGTVAWSDYTLTEADIVVYAQYTYSGKLMLDGKDSDGDGVLDYYQVDSTAGLTGELDIPGYINGVPVAVVVDVSDDGEINGLFGDGITKVIFNDGTTTIGANALAMTADLKEVTLPITITSIGANAFSSTAGGALASKKIAIQYAGTWEDWNAINKESGWESGLTTGTTVICTDGIATLTVSGGFLGYGATYSWSFTANP